MLPLFVGEPVMGGSTSAVAQGRAISQSTVGTWLMVQAVTPAPDPVMAPPVILC